MKRLQPFLTFVVPLLSLIDALQLSSSSSQNHHHQRGANSHHWSFMLPSLHMPLHSPPRNNHVVEQVSSSSSPSSSSSSSSSRRGFLQDTVTKTTTTLALLSPSFLVRAAHASDDVVTATVPFSKKILSDEALKEIILSDIFDRQFLVTGQLTLSAYETTAKWQDEIDTYEIQKWVTGTQKLFVGEQSSVRLVGDITVTPEKVEFRFDEDLMFRLPLQLRPTVHLTGRVILDRNLETGLVSFGREIWDNDVATVLKSAKF